MERTPLIHAAINGHAEIVELLLKQPGIVIDCQDKWKKTATDYAAHFGYTNIVKLLSHANQN